MRRLRLLALAVPVLIALLVFPAAGETTAKKPKRTPTKTPTASFTPVAAAAAAAASAPAPVPPATPPPAKAAPTAKPAPAPAQASGASKADVDAGKVLYDKNCKKCHGAQGEGVARMYALVDAKVVHLGSRQAQSKSDAEIAKEITEGVGKMEAVEDVTPSQAKQITAFMRTLKID